MKLLSITVADKIKLKIFPYLVGDVLGVF